MPEDTPDSNGVAEQYRPELGKAAPSDFMRPAMRTRGTSNANNSKTNGVGVQPEDTRICVVMVGLPARGKSLIAQKGQLSIVAGVAQWIRMHD
jgi:6-phosphofructo-2-kinase/fructose-2,6-biphosphatase 2